MDIVYGCVCVRVVGKPLSASGSLYWNSNKIGRRATLGAVGCSEAYFGSLVLVLRASAFDQTFRGSFRDYVAA